MRAWAAHPSGGLVLVICIMKHVSLEGHFGHRSNPQTMVLVEDTLITVVCVIGLSHQRTHKCCSGELHALAHYTGPRWCSRRQVKTTDNRSNNCAG